MSKFRNIYIILLPAVLLFGVSCSYFAGVPDSVHEEAIRHYLDRWQTLPEQIIISVQRNGVSKTLLKKLDYLDTEIRPKNRAESGPDQVETDRSRVLHLSVSRLQWRGLNTVRVTVSSHTIHDGFIDAHGIEYLLKRENGIWVVVVEGPEWMT